jgi:hypothetical protein
MKTIYTNTVNIESIAPELSDNTDMSMIHSDTGKNDHFSFKTVLLSPYKLVASTRILIQKNLCLFD